MCLVPVFDKQALLKSSNPPITEGKPPGSVVSHIDIILQGSLSGNHYFYILKGVQQIDRTWFLKESGRRYFENTAYFNFDESRARARESKELFPDKVKLRIRFFLDNLRLDGDVLNIPLFMADQTEGLMRLALDQRKAGWHEILIPWLSAFTALAAFLLHRY